MVGSLELQDASHVPPITEEETNTDVLHEIAESMESSLSDRSRPERLPRRDRRHNSSSLGASPLRSSGARRFKLQLMSKSMSLLDTIHLDEIPQETVAAAARKSTTTTTTLRNRRRSDAVERLHDSVSALEGITPEELLQEANRRRNERVHRNKFSASLPITTTTMTTTTSGAAAIRRRSQRLDDAQFRASAPALCSADLHLDKSWLRASSPKAEDVSVEQQQQQQQQQQRPKVIQTRGNTEYLWQRTASSSECLGALELKCELEFDYRAPLQPRYIEDCRQDFETCLQVWKAMELAPEFVKACESVPPNTACCGMLRNDDKTIQETAESLRKGWIKNVNQRLKQGENMFKLDIYVWSWYNATGKAKTSILMIRFFNSRRGF